MNMKPFQNISRIAACISACAAFLFAADSDIRVNSVGFLPSLNKKASVAVRGQSVYTGTFTVNRADDDAAVFTGQLGSNVNNTDTRDTIRVADFSAFATPGKYYLEVPGIGKSPEFSIGEDALNDAYRAMMLGMYLWRCGSPNGVEATYKGVLYKHGACHKNDASLQYAPSGVGTGTRDGTGGWHDAGDFSKYTTNTVHANGLLLKAWEHHGDILSKIPLLKDNSEGNIPAYLSEVKWNIEWLSKMQYEDGRVAEKISTLRHAGHVMPEEDTDTQYFVSWSTTATAGLVAVLALASRIYEPYDAELAEKWLEQAKLGYQALEANASNVAPVQTNFSTGSYAVNDRTHRRWANAEMWETTGDSKYLTAFERDSLPNIWNHVSWDNANVHAAATYILSKRDGRKQTRVDSLEANFGNYAGTLAGNTTSHGYGRVFGSQSNSYYWGNHGALTANSYILNTAYRLSSSETEKARYRNAVHEIVGHIFGRNYFARSFVTGVGHNPPVQPHDRRSMATEKPWPGYIIGGPNNQSLTDNTGPVAPAGATCATAAVCYFDIYSDYARNEIAINWNASMIYALSGLVAAESTPSSSSMQQSSSSSSSEDNTPIYTPPFGHPSARGEFSATYFNLKGEPLGYERPVAPGVYIEKSGKQARKILVK
jgi:endoglucanase